MNQKEPQHQIKQEQQKKLIQPTTWIFNSAILNSKKERKDGSVRYLHLPLLSADYCGVFITRLWWTSSHLQPMIIWCDRSTWKNLWQHQQPTCNTASDLGAPVAVSRPATDYSIRPQYPVSSRHINNPEELAVARWPVQPTASETVHEEDTTWVFTIGSSHNLELGMFFSHIS